VARQDIQEIKATEGTDSSGAKALICAAFMSELKLRPPNQQSNGGLVRGFVFSAEGCEARMVQAIAADEVDYQQE